jgi:hypothetical protein
VRPFTCSNSFIEHRTINGVHGAGRCLALAVDLILRAAFGFVCALRKVKRRFDRPDRANRAAKRAKTARVVREAGMRGANNCSRFSEFAQLFAGKI